VRHSELVRELLGRSAAETETPVPLPSDAAVEALRVSKRHERPFPTAPDGALKSLVEVDQDRAQYIFHIVFLYYLVSRRQMDDDPTMSSFRRYLEAKRTVDDRALNGRIWARLRHELEALRAELEVVDVGAGIGIGAERMLEQGFFEGFGSIRYTAVDPNEELLADAANRLSGADFQLETVTSSLHQLALKDENHGRFDLVIAHALLDILELVPSLRSLLRLTRPGGLLYLPITFDGESFFEPADRSDETILRHYHATMDGRGDSRAGRKTFHVLRALGAEILDVGSSDWVVLPRNGAYPDDEAFFLRFIVDTVERAVQERAQDVHRWASIRRRQIERAELIYIAHQLDYLARKGNKSLSNDPTS
jgi:SAM-dependent methyltransferase